MNAQHLTQKERMQERRAIAAGMLRAVVADRPTLAPDKAAETAVRYAEALCARLNASEPMCYHELPPKAALPLPDPPVPVESRCVWCSHAAI